MLVLVLSTEPVPVVIVEPVTDACQRSYSWPVSVSTMVMWASELLPAWAPAGTWIWAPLTSTRLVPWQVFGPSSSVHTIVITGSLGPPRKYTGRVPSSLIENELALPCSVPPIGGHVLLDRRVVGGQLGLAGNCTFTGEPGNGCQHAG